MIITVIFKTDNAENTDNNGNNNGNIMKVVLMIVIKMSLIKIKAALTRMKIMISGKTSIFGSPSY